MTKRGIFVIILEKEAGTTETIKVFLLGGFRIEKNGTNVVESLRDSRKKSILLQYLLINKERSVPADELFSAIWSSDENSNPENALKTLVSRLRKDLEPFELSGLVSTRHGGYQWDEGTACEFDTEELQRSCNELMSYRTLCDEADRAYLAADRIYVGDILQDTDNKAWIVNESVRYHNMFLEASYHYIRLLKQKGEDERVCDVCCRALELDAQETVFRLELVSTLYKLGAEDEALEHTTKVAELSETGLADKGIDEINRYYADFVGSSKQTERDIQVIANDLAKGRAGSGALFCDYEAFKSVYSTTERNLCRFNVPIFLAVVTVESIGGEALGDEERVSAMSSLLDIMKAGMRRNDTVAIYGENQYVILLPSVNYEQAKTVLERIKDNYYKKQSGQCRVSYRLAPISRQ